MSTKEQNLEILRDNIDKEMCAFRATYPTMEWIRIYNDWYIIGFKESYFEMLMSDYADDLTDEIIEWLSQLNSPLTFLYAAWLECDGAFSCGWDEMSDFLYQLYDDVIGNM